MGRATDMALPPGDPRHGTLNAYGNLGCRCDLCREANTLHFRRVFAVDRPSLYELKRVRQRLNRFPKRSLPMDMRERFMDEREELTMRYCRDMDILIDGQIGRTAEWRQRMAQSSARARRTTSIARDGK